MSDTSSAQITAVSFDFGQTLATIDLALLAEKLAPRGLRAPSASFEAALGAAWAAYDDAIRAGQGGHPWKVFMRALLVGGLGGAPSDEIDRAVDFLWDDQPRQNLWRRPLADMLDLVREIRDRSVPYAILSNSEGKLRELLEEMKISELFPILADSGVLGVEKPDPRIFNWVADKIQVPLGRIVHIGDSFGADVMGALAAGATAIWFRPAELFSGPGGLARAPKSVPVSADLAPRAHVATNAREVRAHLVRMGIPL